MKILIRQFLGQWHSWSVCGWGFATAFKKMGHQVDLFATDGIKHLPSSLKENIIGYHELNHPEKIFGNTPKDQYDCQLSYTCMKNFPVYLSSGAKNRFGIWVYEWAGRNVLPTGFAKSHQHCDWLLSPSQFGKKIFMESGVPENKIQVLPHGIGSEYISNTKMELPTNKSFKILVNIAQNHLRKNISGMLEAFGKAFTNKDDVCLILKAKEKPITQPFEVSLNNCLKQFNEKYPNHAEVKVFSEFIEDMSILYRSVDAHYTMAFCEGYFMPGTEVMASGKLNIAPNWGGQLDFLNSSNALLVSGKEVRANPKSMYWESKPNAIWFEPSIDDAVDKLRFAYQNFESMNANIEKDRNRILKEYSWDSIAQKVIDLCI